jgi:cysteinyl-tRNA synthetase
MHDISPMTISLYNSLTRTIEEFTPLSAPNVTMYSCGPTVYNFAHIGNLRAFLFADVLQRTLRTVGGYTVRWVMNITDIDDKTIRDSAIGSPAWTPAIGEQTNDPKQNLRLFTEYYTQEFVADISAIGIDRAHLYAMPNATDYMAHMQELIRKIYDKGFAYIRGGSVYFDVTKWRKADIYGKLFTIDAENFQEGVRIDADEYDRESVSDFVLWKAQKDGEPSWDFTLDDTNCIGRPGWHIECSAMEYELLGLPFDIHTGGVDLKFPHHEDEIAQSKAGYGVEPTTYWCHNEFLEVEGKKMSKSLGNFYTLRDLTAKGIDPIDVRMLMLSAHYGSRLNFTFAGLDATRKARLRIQDFIYDLVSRIDGKQNALTEATPLTDALRSAVFGELANDLNTPKALAALFTFLNRHRIADVPQEEVCALIQFFRELNEIFAVFRLEQRPAVSVEEIPADIRALAEERAEAKRERNFAHADMLRKDIESRGFILKDTKEGFVIERS